MEDTPNYDAWLTNQPEAKVVGKCASCNSDIYEYETIVKDLNNDNLFCNIHCLENYLFNHMNFVKTIATKKGR